MKTTAPKCMEFIQALAITTSTARFFFLFKAVEFNYSELLCFGFCFRFLYAYMNGMPSQHPPHTQKLLTHVYLGFFLHVLSLFCAW